MFDAAAHLNVFDKSKKEINLSGRSLIVESLTLEDWPVLAAFAARHPQAAPFFGVNPRQANSLPQGWELKLSRYLSFSLSGIGRIGLINPCRTDMKIQKEVFRRQLELAGTLQKPVSLFCLRAWSSLFDIWDSLEGFSSPVIVHVSAITQKNAEKIVKRKGYLSFIPLSLARADNETRSVFCSLTPENLLLETGFVISGKNKEDYAGRLNQCYREAALLRRTTAEELADQTGKNRAFLKR